ncbi:MAG: Holliday junction DNA helicase RuvB C-terminal domain-containing protein [Nanoarchaeota archaeon]
MNYFKNVVGQNSIKKRLGFYIDAYNSTSIFPNTIFIAPKGCGKTLMARETGRNLFSSETLKPKKFIEINCATLKNTKQFVNQVVHPHMRDREATLLFDEASEIPRDLSMALLTILNPNPTNKTEFVFDDFVYEFDFKRHTFFFATTESQSVFHALMDRINRIELEEYSLSDLSQIILLSTDGFKIENDTLGEVASILRGNARAAQKISGDIITYLKKEHKNTFSLNDWNILKDLLGINPLGLSQIELRILKILSQRSPNEERGFSLTQLSSMTDMTRSSLQQDIEKYLLRYMLMEITTGGRKITQRGLDYLNKLPKS